MDEDRRRPATDRDEVERTGRTAQVTGDDANQGFGSPGSPGEQTAGRDEKDPRSVDDTDDLRGGGA